MALHESFLNIGRFRWLWVATVLCTASIIAYIWHDPVPVPNGGTWLGYTLGTIGALLILWLMWFGIRKRRYRGGTGTLRGWLSAHIYLGGSLIVITLLHSGFQVGWNVHTLALVLMLIVIFSGFFGVFAYLRYPTAMTQNRQSATLDALLDEIGELDQQCLQIADSIDPKIHAVVVRSVAGSQIGGTWWRQLFPRDTSAQAFDETRAALDQISDDVKRKDTMRMATMVVMVDALVKGDGGKKSEDLRRLLDLLGRKKQIVSRVAQDLQFKALMDVWLYFHVPLSFALLAALIAHVISVFFYW